MNDTDRINFLEHLLARKTAGGRAYIEYTKGAGLMLTEIYEGEETVREAIDAAYKRFLYEI